MRATGCVLFLILTQCVFSFPLNTSHMDNHDIKVIKCIVDVLASTLNKPQLKLVTEECLETLRTDDRLVSILRHQNFLEELQEIGQRGVNQLYEKAMEASFGHETGKAEVLDTTADQSMLMALKRGSEEVKDSMEGEEKEKKITVNQNERDQYQEDQEDPGPTKKEHKSKEIAVKTSDINDEKSLNLDKDASELKNTEESHEELKSIQDRSGLVSLQKSTFETKTKSLNHMQQLSLHGGQGSLGSEQQNAPHRSEGVWKSSEEQELRIMARSNPEERKEDEGSASKKTEDAEMESLAVIESELESMAQKLHGLRQG